MANPAIRPLSLEEYFEIERASDERHEFLDGEVFAMSGASLAHNLIDAQLVQSLGPRVRDAGCTLVSGNLRVRVAKTGLYTYPDAVIFCGTAELSREGGLDTLLNPRVLFEILSPSTEAYDRTTKFDHYRTISTLDEYVLLAQDERRVEVFRRAPAATPEDQSRWDLEEVRGDGVLRLASLDVSVPLDEIYSGVA